MCIYITHICVSACIMFFCLCLNLFCYLPFNVHNVFFFLSEEFLLEDTKSYTFLSNGHIQVPGVDEVQEFRNTCNAMSIMGLSPEDLKGINNNFLFNLGSKFE